MVSEETNFVRIKAKHSLYIHVLALVSEVHYRLTQNVCLVAVLLWVDILVSYALFVMQDYLTDVWKLSFTHATGILNTWGGISKIVPVFFLFFVDTLLGNFKMLVISSISYSVGISLVTISTPPVLANATGTCKEYSAESVGVADNLVSVKPFHESQGTTICLRVQVFIVLALLSAIGGIALPYIKPWTVRFGVPAICTIIATLVFMTGWCGRSKYKKDRPGPDPSPITNIFRVYVAAASKMCTSFPDDANSYHKNNENETFKPTRFLRCLEKAAIKSNEGDSNVCLVAQEEEAKIAVRMVPMWMTFVVRWIVSSVANTYFVEQAKNMDRHVGKLNLPTQILLLVFDYSKVLFGMLAARILQSGKRWNEEVLKDDKKGKKDERTTYMKVAPAIGIGLSMVFSVLCCITAAKIEKRRLGVIRRHGLLDKPDEDIPMSMFWLVFQFILLAGLDTFLETSVTEFYTHESPGSMKKYLEYLTMWVSGLGVMCSTLCVYVVGKISERGGKISWFQETLNMSRLDRYYWVLAGLSFVNLLVFVFVAYFYKYKNLEPPNSSSGGGEDGQGQVEPVTKL